MTETTLAQEPKTEKTDLMELDKERNNLIAMADNFIVNDRESFNLASEFITGVINPFIDRVKNDIGPVVKQAHVAWKKAKELMAQYEDPATEAKAILNRKKGNWELAEMRRIEEENRKKLEAERKAEQERLKAEQEAQEIAKKAMQEAQIKAAIELENNGHKEQADKILSMPTPVPKVEIARTAPGAELQQTIEKTDGEKKIVEWVWRLKSAENFDTMTRSFLMPDEVKINRAVKAYGRDAEKLVGNIIVEERIRYAYERKK